MKGQTRRKQRAHQARAQKKRDKRRAEMKRRGRGKRETPRGDRTRWQGLTPVVKVLTAGFDVMGWLEDRRAHRRQKVA